MISIVLLNELAIDVILEVCSNVRNSFPLTGGGAVLGRSVVVPFEGLLLLLLLLY